MLSVKHYTSTEGYTYLLEPGESGSQNLHFGILKLHTESTYFDHTESHEVALVPLIGRCTLLVGHNGNKANGLLGARGKTTFESEGCAAFIPHHTTYEILPQSQNVEIAICKTPSHYNAAAVINPSGPIETPPNYQLHIVENDTASEWIGETVGFHRFQNGVGSATVLGDQTGEKQARTYLRHNELLVIPEKTRARIVACQGELYQLMISRITLPQ